MRSLTAEDCRSIEYHLSEGDDMELLDYAAMLSKSHYEDQRLARSIMRFVELREQAEIERKFLRGRMSDLEFQLERTAR